MLFVQACKSDKKATQLGSHTSVVTAARMMAAMAGWWPSMSCNIWH